MPRPIKTHLRLIAEYEWVNDLEKSMPQLKGFVEFWVKELTPDQVKVLKEYQRIKKNAGNALARQAKKI